MNYTSKPYQINQPVARGDLNVDFQVLNTLQSRYDANKAAADQMMSAYESLKGERPEDNEYIATLVSQVKSKIEGQGNIRYEHRSSVDAINRTMRNVIENPIVKDAILSKGVMDNFRTEIAKKKEKNDGTYSDVNAEDALEQGGYYDYLKGKTNRLTNISYKNYRDVGAKLHKVGKEYSELMGKEQLLDTATNKYYVTDTYGKRVFVEDIYKALQSNLDTNDIEQLRINARQSVGKLDETSKSKLLSSFSETEKSLNNIEIAKKEALLSNTSGEQAKYLKLQINELKNKGKELSNITIYDYYNKTFLGDIADTYDMDVVTKRDFNDMPLEILKFESDEADKLWQKKKFQLEYEQKEREISQKNAQAPNNPIINDKAYALEEEESDNTILTKSFGSSASALKQYLMQTDENDFNSKSAEEQTAYMQSLAGTSSDVFSKDYSEKRQNLLTDYTSNFKAVSERRDIAVKELANATRTAFDNITGAKLDNLKGELPLTAKFKKQGKKFNDLSSTEKAALYVEMGSNWYRYGDGYVDSNINNDDYKHILNVATQSWMMGLKKSDKTGELYNSALQSYKKSTITRNENIGGYLRQPMFDRGKNLPTPPPPKFFNPFSQDTNLTELEEYTGDTKINTADTFSEMAKNIYDRTTSAIKSKAQSLRENKVFTYSPDVKEHNYSVESLKALVLNTDDATIPNDKSTYSIEKKGKGYNVYYQDEDKNIKEIYIESLPQSVRNTFETTSSDWNRSLRNPNVNIPKFTLNVNTMNTGDVASKVESIATQRPDLLPTDVYLSLYNSKDKDGFKNTIFESRQSLLKRVITPNLSQKQQDEINKIVNADYNFTPKLVNGVILYDVNVNIDKGNKISKRYTSNKKEQTDDAYLKLEAMENMMAIRNELIYDVLNGQ